MVDVHETFNKADGANWGPDLTWTAHSGVATTTSSRGTTSNHPIYMQSSGNGLGADQYVEMQQVGSIDRNGVILRMDTDTAWYYLYFPSLTEAHLTRRQGSFTTLSSATISALSSLDVLRIEITGSNPATLKGFVNGSSVISATDSNLTTGDQGAILNRGFASVDDWKAGDVGAAPVAAPKRLFTMMGVGR